MLHNEGEVYKVYEIEDKSFTIYYGYYSDLDREGEVLLPIFPNFYLDPVYTKEGFPYCTRIQDTCHHYCCRHGGSGDGWCSDCVYYPDESMEIAVCMCNKRKITKKDSMEDKRGNVRNEEESYEKENKKKESII
ncbi:MAG: hypothetical protein ACOX1S_03560 [Anaerostipes sp.]